MSRFAALLAVVALSGAGSYLLFGSGGDEPRSASAAFLPGNARVGAGGVLNQVPTANCTQWRAGSPQQKDAVVDQLGAFFEDGGHIWAGARMPDGEAYETLEAACSRGSARRIRLYKIYARALAFRELRAER